MNLLKNFLKWHKILRNPIILEFCHYPLLYEAFFNIQNCVYFFTKDSLTTSSYLVERFHHSKPRFSKVRQNCLKTLKIRTFWNYREIQSDLEDFFRKFHMKVSWSKVFNILSPQVHQKFDKVA